MAEGKKSRGRERREMGKNVKSVINKDQNPIPWEK
jgi:hypothetical protein